MHDTPTPLTALRHVHGGPLAPPPSPSPSPSPHRPVARVRPARAADADAACALLRASITRACAPDHAHDPGVLTGWLANKTPSQVAAWIGSAASHSLVAEADGTIAGIALVTRKGRIALLHVDPDRQRDGIGSALLAGLERQARAWGLAELRTDATRCAVGFFVRRGYRAGAPVRTAYGLDAVAFAKRLVPSYARRPACGCDGGGTPRDRS